MAGTYAANSTQRADTGSVTLGANNDFIVLGCGGFDTIGIQIPTGLTGTVSYTASIDGTNYVAINGTTIGLAASASSDVNPAGVLRYFDVTAVTFFRVQITAYTSGSCVVSWVCENSPSGNGVSTVGFISPGNSASSLGKSEDNPHTSGDTGVAIWGVRNDTRAVGTSTDGDYGSIAIHPSGAVYVTPVVTTSGISINAATQFRLAAAGSTNATSIKGSAGQVYQIIACNTSAAIKYVKFYNKATAPTVGTDTPTLVLGIPPTSTQSFLQNDYPLSFTTGIAMATTGLGTDADATAVTANDLMITVMYI